MISMRNRNTLNWNSKPSKKKMKKNSSSELTVVSLFLSLAAHPWNK
jgi:hypothetical protein